MLVGFELVLFLCDEGEELEECGMWFECMVVDGLRFAGERVASRG